MSKHVSRLLSALSATGASLIVSALPAVAGVAIDETRCDDLGENVGTACFTTKGESSIVETPNGNLIIQYNVRYDYTITRPKGNTISGSGHDHWHTVERNGEIQEHNMFIKKTVTDSVTGETCTIEQHFVSSNGEVRHEGQTGTCA